MSTPVNGAVTHAQREAEFQAMCDRIRQVQADGHKMDALMGAESLQYRILSFHMGDKKASPETIKTSAVGPVNMAVAVMGFHRQKRREAEREAAAAGR